MSRWRTAVMVGGGAAAAGYVAVAAGLAFGQAPAQPRQVQGPRFEVDPLWPKPLPNRWLLGSAVGIAVDARDHVFVLHLIDSFNQRTEIGAASSPPTSACCRPAPAVLEFDPEGNLVRSWGGPDSAWAWPVVAQGLAIDDRGDLWIGGAGGTDSHLLRFSRDGRFRAQIGARAAAAVAARTAADTAYAGVATAGRAAGAGRGRGAPPPLPPNSSSTDRFGGPAGVAFDAQAGELLVADGARNRRVVVLDAVTGAVKRFWGAYGAPPSDSAASPYDPAAPASRHFSVVRCARPSRDGLVYVCDRQNDRIQVFRRDGSFVTEARIAPATRGEGSVWDLTFSHDPGQRYVYVADGSNMKVHVLDRRSLEPVTSFGDGGRYPGQFLAVHSIATDSKGNVYTAETYEGKRVQKFVFRGIGTVPREQGVVRPPTTGGGR